MHSDDEFNRLYRCLKPGRQTRVSLAAASLLDEQTDPTLPQLFTAFLRRASTRPPVRFALTVAGFTFILLTRLPLRRMSLPTAFIAAILLALLAIGAGRPLWRRLSPHLPNALRKLYAILSGPLLLTSATSASAWYLLQIGITVQALFVMLVGLTISTLALGAWCCAPKIKFDVPFALDLLVWQTIGVTVVSLSARAADPMLVVGGVLFGVSAMLLSMSTLNAHLFLSARLPSARIP